MPGISKPSQVRRLPDAANSAHFPLGLEEACGVALAFEVPVFVLGLVRLRILSAARLRATWRFGLFAMTALGVLLPGVDPVSTALSVVTLILLYALSIALAMFFEPRWRGTRAAEPAPDV